VKISDQNEIDVNMKTNTTEQTTIGDTDLFLLSDTTGETIKYITGSNLKQQGLTHLEGGTNVNLTTNLSNGNTVINLDNNIDTAGSITCENFVKINNSDSATSSFGGILNLEGSVPQTTYPLRYKQQIFNNSNGDAYQIIGEDNASNQRVLFELHTATNNTTTHTANFNTANLTGVNKINTYDANVLTVNNNNQQYLIKDTNKNFSPNSIISVDSNHKISSINATDVLANLIAGNNLTKTGNTLNVDADLTGITSIKSTSGPLTLNSTGGTAQNIYLQLDSANIMSLFTFAVTSNRKTVIQPTTDIYTNEEFMLHIKPFQGKDCRVCIESDMNNSGGESHNPSLLFRQDGGGIKMEQGLNANNQFYFFHPNTSSTWSRFRFHCGDTATDTNGQPTDASLKLSIEKDKILFYQPIFTDNQINFQTNTTNHFIKFSDTNMDGILLAAYGGGTNNLPLFRIQTTNPSISSSILFDVSATDPNVTNATTGITKVYHKLAVVKNDATLQDDGNDVFTVRNTGFVKSLLHSDSGDCELAFKTGSEQALLKYFTNKFFQIITPTDSEFSVNLGSQKVIYFKKESTNYSTVLSSGPGANGNNILFIMADTDGAVDSANPSLEFHQDASTVTFKMGIRESLNRSYINAALNSDLSIQKAGTDRIKVDSYGVTVYGIFTNLSDDRTKYGETTITNALTTIKKLNPVSYRQTDGLDLPDNPDLPVHWGFVAQELYNTVPEMRFAVSFNKTLKRNFVDGNLDGNCVEDIYDEFTTSKGEVQEYPEICSIAYNSFSALNVKAIQELLIRVETLETQVETQTTQPDLTETVKQLLAKVESQDAKITKLTEDLETLRVAQYY
tara:strand:- start:265 stop:2805 length:2541 start_codon:yes stop_codon:yes gene_type:complete